MTGPARLVAAGTAAFGAGLSSLAVLQHRAFWTGRFDVGNLVQAVWSTANGDFLSVTGLTGKQISRLGAHFDPIVAAFAPLWWLWPDPALLLVTQGLAVATGAVPVYLLGRRHLDSEWVAAGLALAYLLHPADAVARPGRLPPRRARHAAPAVGLLVPRLGASTPVRARRRRRVPDERADRAGRRGDGPLVRIPARTAAGRARDRGRRAAVSIVAVAVVVPHFAPAAGRRSRAATTRRRIAGWNREDSRHATPARHLRDHAWPRPPLPRRPAAPPPRPTPPRAARGAHRGAGARLNLLSGTRTQTSIHFHYTAGALPGLFVAAILGAARLRRRFAWARWPEGRAVVLSTVLAGVLLGPLPLWRHVPLGSGLGTHEHVVGHHAAVARRALELVPPGAAVSATNTLGAHLSERRRVFSFPVLGESTWVAVDRQRPSYRDTMDAPVRFERALAALRARDEFGVVFDEDGILVLRKDVTTGSSAGAGTP